MEPTLQHKKLTTYILFFFAGCFLGYVWEVLVYWQMHRGSAGLWEIISQLRGFLHGPWVPIYGFGCVIMLALRERYQTKPVQFFLISVFACSALEYVTSWSLEMLFGARWWDYSDALLNLNGRICVVVSLFFGAAGMVVAYVLEPIFQKLMNRWPWKLRTAACTVISLAFLLDVLLSVQMPNLGIGVKVL